MLIPYTWIEQARERITPYIRFTPLTYDPHNDLYIKWENQQVTGSFKARGALNKVLSLQDWERQRGIVTASAGNHGQGVALAGQITKAPVIVFCSESAVPAKLEAIRSLGAELRLVPGGYSDAEHAGLEYAQQSGATWVSAYNDGQVIAGQATLALEMLNDLPALAQTTWLVPVSGGGLLSGVGASLRAPETRLDDVRLIGVQTQASAHMHDLFYHGTQDNTPELPSIADGLAGPVEPGALTIPLIRKFVDEIVLVSEAELRSAIRYSWERYGERIEASGAATLAAALSGRIPDRPGVLVISGGNIQPELHASICRTES